MSNSKPENTEEFISKEFSALGDQVNLQYPELTKKLEKLTKKELQRVALAIIGYPVEQGKDLSSKKEEDAAVFGIKLKQDIFHMTLEYIKNEQLNNKGTTNE